MPKCPVCRRPIESFPQAVSYTPSLPPSTPASSLASPTSEHIMHTPTSRLSPFASPNSQEGNFEDTMEFLPWWPIKFGEDDPRPGEDMVQAFHALTQLPGQLS